MSLSSSFEQTLGKIREIDSLLSIANIKKEIIENLSQHRTLYCDIIADHKYISNNTFSLSLRHDRKVFYDKCFKGLMYKENLFLSFNEIKDEIEERKGFVALYNKFLKDFISEDNKYGPLRDYYKLRVSQQLEYINQLKDRIIKMANDL